MQPVDDAPIDPEQTADLIERVQHGDREALEILFARHLPLLKRWASGRLPHWARDLADTADLVQATALDAFRSLSKFEVRGDGALQAYLRQALMNRLRNELRRVSRKPVPSVLDGGVVDDAQSPLEAAIKREQLAKYTSALDHLAAADREAIIGRVEFGLSYAELAELLGKSTPEAARKTVTRALVKLAEQMS